MTMLDVQPAALELQSDEQLVARVRAGETCLFEVLMRRNNQRLYRAVRAILRDESDVEDVMQQAYVAAFTHLGQFAGAARFATWLLRIGMNEAKARLRGRRRHLVSIDDPQSDDVIREDEPMPTTPEDRAAGRELAALLEETVDRLPELYREVFMLRLVEELSTADTAAVLGLGEEAVKQRLHRARAMVQQAIEARLGASAQGAFSFQAPRCDRVVAAVMARIAR